VGNANILPAPIIMRADINKTQSIRTLIVKMTLCAKQEAYDADDFGYRFTYVSYDDWRYFYRSILERKKIDGNENRKTRSRAKSNILISKAIYNIIKIE